jgi:hypothetical protein
MLRNRLAVLLSLLFLPAGAASAGEWFVLRGPSTVVQLVNGSDTAATAVIEVLGDRAQGVELSIDAGAMALWENASHETGALRVTSDAPLEVLTGTPVLAAFDRVRDGVLPPAVPENDLAWSSGVMLVNPADRETLVTLTSDRGEEHLFIPARGVRFVERTAGDGLTFRAASPLLVVAYDANQRSGARVFRPVRPNAIGGRRRSVRSGSPLPPPPPPPPPPVKQTVVLTPSKDNTLYQSSNGGLSNGAGIHIFAGNTRFGNPRRALLAFDVASQVPPGSRVTRVSLTMRVSQTPAGAEPMRIHRVSRDWGEGTSNAGNSSDGDGAPAKAGDATWIHTFFPSQQWTNEGGDFTPAADATASVANIGTWESAEMIARVQEWVDQPDANFGWIVIGNENDSSTAKRFDSREIVPAATRPALTVEYEH